ncbi:restriction endonuclease subunit S [Streptococcus hyointestinalis]|uniref:restriction endonuclease subunit S n=1 Tax=Streptococcus hyointestinalis TaxID=1337 RepID=UPI003517E202
MTPEQLKASILQRAMEGKLVPQDPNDDPASELLKRIKAEKEKLIAEGKIRRDKKETEFFRGEDGKPYEKLAGGSVQEVEVPYEIPESWEWVRFSLLADIVRGGSPRPIKEYLTTQDDGINWIKIGDTEKGGKYINNVNEKIKPSGLSKTRFVKKGTFLLTNSMSFGRPYILNVDGAIHDGWLAISNYESSLDKNFLFYLLSSKTIYSQFLKLISGAVVKNLNSEKVSSTLLPLPPLAEQKRIVTQIERVLKRVEAYAESYNKLQELDKTFPDKLKKSILQYAMQGKLVAQDPNDEPVEVLLEKIRAEKQKLYEEGKLKKKDLAEIVVEKGDDNSPYGKKDENINFNNSTIADIPNSWRYVKFGGLVLFNIGKTPPRSETIYWGNDIPWVSISDISNNSYITKTKEYLSDLAIKQKNIKVTPAGTLLMSFKLSIGKVALLEIPASHNEAIISIFPYGDKENIIRDYLMRFLPLIATAGNSKDAIKGKTLNSTSISGLLIPVSNYREMKDIVTKVDLLFEKVNQLCN